mgnify:FL=1
MFRIKLELKRSLVVFSMGVIAMCSSQNMIEDSMNIKDEIDQAIQNGEFTTANQLISQYLDEETLSD